MKAQQQTAFEKRNAAESRIVEIDREIAGLQKRMAELDSAPVGRGEFLDSAMERLVEQAKRFDDAVANSVRAGGHSRAMVRGKVLSSFDGSDQPIFRENDPRPVDFLDVEVKGVSPIAKLMAILGEPFVGQVRDYLAAKADNLPEVPELTLEQRASAADDAVARIQALIEERQEQRTRVREASASIDRALKLQDGPKPGEITVKADNDGTFDIEAWRRSAGLNEKPARAVRSVVEV